MAQQDKGLLGGFGQFGVPDTLTQEELLQQRQQERIQNALRSAQQSAGRTPGEQQLAQGGALIGAGIKNFFSKKKDISPQEALLFKTREEAKAEFKAREKSGQFEDMSIERKAIERQRIMSEVAAENGLSDMASQLAIQSAQASFALNKAETEQKILEQDFRAGEIKEDRDTLELDIRGEDRDRLLAGQTGGFVVPDANGKYNFTGQPDVVTGEVGPDGRLDNGKIDLGTSFLTIKEYEQLAKRIQDIKGGGAGDEGTLRQRRKDFLSALPEKKAFREQMGAMNVQLQIMNRVGDLVNEFLDAGNDPRQILDKAGGIANFVDQVKDTIIGVGKTFKFRTSIGDATDEKVLDFNDLDPSNEKFQELYGDIEIALPADLDDTAQAAAEYKSMIVQLAYATARANEPGARQLSDNDFRNALKEIGADAADPGKLINTVMRNLGRKVENFGETAKLVKEIGDEFRVDGETIIFGNRLPDFNRRIGETNTSFDALRNRLGQDPLGLGTFLDEQPPAAAPGQQPVAPANVIRVDENGNIL